MKCPNGCVSLGGKPHLIYADTSCPGYIGFYFPVGLYITS